MKAKPSSANSKNPIFSEKQLLAKKPTIVKCFICNQMFYSQQTFDTHMDYHQRKVNKNNLPEQIQRKTQQSFGLKRKQSANKKNTTLQAINQNQIAEKKLLSKTLKLGIIPTQKYQNSIKSNLKESKPMIKKNISAKESFNGQKVEENLEKEEEMDYKRQPYDKEIQQIDKALEESSFLMSQIIFLTQNQQPNEQQDIVKGSQAESDEDQVFERQLSETQFIKTMHANNFTLPKIEQLLLKTQFSHNKGLQNCQIQVQYLRKIGRLSSDVKTSQKINKIRYKILKQVLNLIMANEALFSNIKSSDVSLPQNDDITEENNLQPNICASCLDVIKLGQKCINANSEKYHKSCFEEAL